jgi:hypothetical protein
MLAPLGDLSELFDMVERKTLELVHAAAKQREEDAEFDVKLRLATGLVLCFLGGQFQTTFAFSEAFYQAGWTPLSHQLSLLRPQLSQAAARFQSDPDENVQRKLARSYQCLDQGLVKQTLNTLSVCLLAAVTAVQLRFAKILSMGGVLGEFVKQHLVEKYLSGWLRSKIDPALHPWIPTLTDVLLRVCFTALALRLSRTLIMVSSAVRGGEMILDSINTLCKNRNMELLTKGPGDEAMVVSLVSFGVLAQVMAGSGTRAVFNVLCLPLAVSEFVLSQLNF